MVFVVFLPILHVLKLREFGCFQETKWKCLLQPVTLRNKFINSAYSACLHNFIPFQIQILHSLCFDFFLG